MAPEYYWRHLCVYSECCTDKHIDVCFGVRSENEAFLISDLKNSFENLIPDLKLVWQAGLYMNN